MNSEELMKNSKSVLEDLQDVFQNVNSWLNFAEVKHGALIALDTTFILGIITLIVDKKLDGSSMWGLGIIIISLLISMYSYYPNIKWIKDEWMIGRKKVTPNRNLLFYRDIFQLSNKEYLEKIYKDYYNIQVSEFKKKEIDYAEEIVVNSRITMKKYFLFKISLVSCSIGILVLIVPLFIG